MKILLQKKNALNRIAKNSEQINQAYGDNEGAFITFLNNRFISINTFKEENEKYKQQAVAILAIPDTV